MPYDQVPEIAKEIAVAMFGSPVVKAVMGLLLANIVVGIAGSLYTGEFRLGATADFLRTRAIPLVLGGGVVQLLLLTVPSEWSGITAPVANTVWFGVCITLLGKILDTLNEVGIHIQQPAPTPVVVTPGAVPTTQTTLAARPSWRTRMRGMGPIPAWLRDVQNPGSSTTPNALD